MMNTEYATKSETSVRLALIETGLATKYTAPTVLRAVDGSQLIRLSDAQRQALEARGFTFALVGSVTLVGAGVTVMQFANRARG